MTELDAEKIPHHAFVLDHVAGRRIETNCIGEVRRLAENGDYGVCNCQWWKLDACDGCTTGDCIECEELKK